MLQAVKEGVDSSVVHIPMREKLLEKLPLCKDPLLPNKCENNESTIHVSIIMITFCQLFSYLNTYHPVSSENRTHFVTFPRGEYYKMCDKNR